MRRFIFGLLFAMAVAGCDGREPVDGSVPRDGSAAGDGGLDASVRDDAGAMDGAIGDGSTRDAGATGVDASGAFDGDAGGGGGSDAGPPDSGVDAGVDSGVDAGVDSGVDAGVDAGVGGGCITDPTATHAVRFEWTGSRPSSTAYVVYEENTLPDTSRWHVSSASSSFSYTPTYGDTFLGDGGLVLEGTAFIDVELSTVGLSSIRGVTIAIRGRSYDTTTSGSFTWQTFDGTGASPYGSVANSTPYEWYAADATTEFSPGDSGVLLRLRAGPPSGSLIVNRVEVCFDAS